MTNPLTNAARAERAKEALAIYTMLTSSGAHPSMMNPIDLEVVDERCRAWLADEVLGDAMLRV